MIQLTRKIDEFPWHCHHPCNHGADPKTNPKAFRYSVIAPGMGALAVLITRLGGSVQLHRAQPITTPAQAHMLGGLAIPAPGRTEGPADAKPCDLLLAVGPDGRTPVMGRCFLSETIPLRAVGPWAGQERICTLRWQQARLDSAMQFMTQNAVSGSRDQPETFWQGLQSLLVAGLMSPGGIR
jgi:hypothetical protein